MTGRKKVWRPALSALLAASLMASSGAGSLTALADLRISEGSAAESSVESTAESSRKDSAESAAERAAEDSAGAIAARREETLRKSTESDIGKAATGSDYVELQEDGIDFDSYEEDIDKDFSQAAQLPLTGKFYRKFSDGRRVSAYIAPEASVRTYVTIVAVPDGTADVWDFLETNGWIDLADEKGEMLFVLEPGADGWKNAEEEEDYLKEAIDFLKSGNNAKGKTVFSTFGEFYAAGFGKGAAALEYWTAQNPILVISQAYVDGESAGDAALDAVSREVYTGKSSNGDISDVLTATLKQVGIDGKITPADVPVPTLLAGYTGSEQHWKKANDCGQEETEGTFYQKKGSDAYATEYANRGAGDHGLAEVAVDDAVYSAEEIYGWMSRFTRYDTTFAYSNALAGRLDYTEARVRAQQEAAEGSDGEDIGSAELIASADQKIDGHGTVQVGILSFADDNKDGVNDPREYILYIPDGFADKKLPVVMVWPGNTQTDSIFMDSTLWWNIADQEGIAVAFVCETYGANACSVSHADNDGFYNALMDLLREKIDQNYAELDFDRVYSTGQSAGSNATQTFALQHPEYFAAAATTSGAPFSIAGAAGKMIPNMMITGQMDAGDMAKGFDSASLKAWGDYFLEADGIAGKFAADSASAIIRDTDSRHPVIYSWQKDCGGTAVPLLQWSQCLLRPHNCYPSDIAILYDYLKHFSSRTEDGRLVRYYSPSAFEQDEDAIVISEEAQESGNVRKLSAVAIPETDHMRGVLQPITGMLEDDTLACGRSGAVYIPEGCRYGAYVYYVAVPEGKKVWEFLRQSGWIAEADEKGFIIYALQPQDGAADDAEYIEEAVASGASSKYYKTAGSYYLVGYGALGTELQKFGLKNPLTVAAAAYMDASDIDRSFIAGLKNMAADTHNTGSCDKIPTPVWLMGSDRANVQEFYQRADGCTGSDTEQGAFHTTVFKQTADSAYTAVGKVCEVAAGDSPENIADSDLTGAVCTFLNRYYAYGSVASGWSTGIKPDYGNEDGQVGRVEFTQDFDGEQYAREYLVYDGAHGRANAPVIFIAPGSGTVDTVNLDTAGWAVTADKYGVIVIGLTATVGKASDKAIGTIGWTEKNDGLDIQYLRMVVDRVKADFPEADRSRFYINGQSQGCVFAQHAALFMNDVFAAAGVTSGPLMDFFWDLTEKKGDPSGLEKYGKIPFKIIMGQYDISKPEMPPVEGLKNTLNLFTYLNGLTADPTGKYAMEAYEKAEQEGRFVPYIYRDEHGFPVVQYDYDTGRGHSIVYEDTGNLTKWLLLWAQDEEGSYVYKGQSVPDQPENPKPDEPKPDEPNPENPGGHHSGGGSGHTGGGHGGNRVIIHVEAGQWRQDQQGWWYQTGTSYAADTWKQIGGKWYHFNHQGYMDTGWQFDPSVNCWYYLDVNSGAMVIGWQQISGLWYYFETVAGQNQGHMYAGTATPDGYQVGADGAWVK